MSIVFENVTKAYDSAVLENVSISFKEKEITALLGTSGRGKTTVLRLLASLEKADSGRVSVGGKVGVLFQEHRLIPTLSAIENVLLACKDKELAKNALKLCKADLLASKLPDEMSGGERQRVALARLVAFDGDVWLLDEPFSALDSDTKQDIIDNLLPIMKKKTVILVTHSDEEAKLADNVIRL